MSVTCPRFQDKEVTDEGQKSRSSVLQSGCWEFFSIKDRIENWRGRVGELCGPWGLCHNYSIQPLQHEKGHDVNKSMWLHPDNTLVYQQQAQFDLWDVLSQFRL